MAIPNTRTQEAAQIIIHTQKCSGCAQCVAVCSDFSLLMKDGKATPADNPLFGCIGCGHCMAICKENAIEITGRTLSKADLYPLPSAKEMADYNQVLALLQHRRSIRLFNNKDINPELTEKILTAARTAPMGIPPSDVNVIVLNSREKTRAFAIDFCNYLHSMKWFVSDGFLTLMRPFWGKATDDMFRKFIKPLFSVYTQGMKDGKNLVNYDAPLAMYFYGSPYTDPADPIIAATYAMITAESLGLGTCMLGAVHPLIQNGKKAGDFRRKYNIKHKSREGLFVIFGYHDLHYRHGIGRTFASEVFL